MLGGFTSAVVLGVIALLIAWESVGRLVRTPGIRFDEAIVVALLGLVVNLISAWMLSGPKRGGSHSHDELGSHHDHNLRAAYLHVLADALTSVLAIVALTAGRFLGWVWMDPLMGLVGSVIIGRWSYGLMRDTSGVLLDGAVDASAIERVRTAVERDSDNAVADIHLWRIGPRDVAGILSIVTHEPRPTEHYRDLIANVLPLSHVTVEVNRCPTDDCDGTQGSVRRA